MLPGFVLWISLLLLTANGKASFLCWKLQRRFCFYYLQKASKIAKLQKIMSQLEIYPKALKLKCAEFFILLNSILLLIFCNFVYQIFHIVKKNLQPIKVLVNLNRVFCCCNKFYIALIKFFLFKKKKNLLNKLNNFLQYRG